MDIEQTIVDESTSRQQSATEERAAFARDDVLA
jgi:hypothetical protein